MCYPRRLCNHGGGISQTTGIFSVCCINRVALKFVEVPRKEANRCEELLKYAAKMPVKFTFCYIRSVMLYA